MRGCATAGGGIGSARKHLALLCMRMFGTFALFFSGQSCRWQMIWSLFHQMHSLLTPDENVLRSSRSYSVARTVDVASVTCVHLDGNGMVVPYHNVWTPQMCTHIKFCKELSSKQCASIWCTYMHNSHHPI